MASAETILNLIKKMRMKHSGFFSNDTTTIYYYIVII